MTVRNAFFVQQLVTDQQQKINRLNGRISDNKAAIEAGALDTLDVIKLKQENEIIFQALTAERAALAGLKTELKTRQRAEAKMATYAAAADKATTAEAIIASV